MKIPQIFLLEKPSENKLEKLLQVTMIRKISDYKYECYCDVCEDLAGSIEVVFGKISKPDYSRISCWPGTDLFRPRNQPRYEEPKLVIKNFYGTIDVKKDEEFLESVITDLEKKDLKSVYKKLNGNYLTFYNLDEDKCYCWPHFKDYWEKKISSF